MPKKAKLPVDRSNVLNLKRLAKKHSTSIRGSACSELDLMLTHVAKKVTMNLESVVNLYAKKEETIKPKVLQAVLNVTLAPSLRTSACDAGAAAASEYVAKKSKKERAAA